MNVKIPELLAPAGSPEGVRAAVQSGAGAAVMCSVLSAYNNIISIINSGVNHTFIAGRYLRFLFFPATGRLGK